MILGIDPSSKRTGWAVLEKSGRLVEAGYITGRTHATAPDRIIEMVAHIFELFDRFELDQVVVELPGPRVHANRAGGGNGLTVYGLAAGAIWMACRMAAGGLETPRRRTPAITVEPAIETVWTQRIPKPIRQRQIAALYPEYRSVSQQDGGGDISDAIGLCLWRLGVLRKEASLRRAKDV